MSVLVAGGAAAAYAATVVSVYRWYIRRQRALAGGFPALGRLDWGALVSDLLPTVAGPPPAGVPATLPSGEPTPSVLLRAVPPGAAARRSLLAEVVGGARLALDDPRLSGAGFTGSEARWVATVSLVRSDPARALERVEAAAPSSAAEVYLREHLRLGLRTHALNREVAVFACKRRVASALARFGDAPPLYFVRAQASALAGMNRAAIDDLARAVYFSRQDPFYVRAVLDSPYVAEVRPALAYQCRHALDARGRPGEPPRP